MNAHSNGSNPNQKLWFEQKELSGYLPYISIYQKLDELTTAGFTCLQIEEMLNLGEKKWKKKRKKSFKL